MSGDVAFTGRRVVVTGGSGFIGRALLSELRYNQYPHLVPIALARSTSDIVSLQRLLDYHSADPSVVIGDLGSVESLQPCVSEADVVVHLAADMNFFSKDKSALFQTNVSGTRNLLEACSREAAKRNRAMRFVYVSSTEVFGSTDGLGKAGEDAPRRPDSDYGRSKVLAEDVVQEYSDRLGTIILRPTGVYGPEERFFFFEMMQMVASGIALLAPSPMTGKLMFTHIDDVVSGLMLSVTHPDMEGKVFNLCPDESVTNRAIVEKLADTLGYPRPLIYLNKRIGVALMRLIAPLMNWGKRRIFIYNPKTVLQTMRDREYSNMKLRGLGYVPQYSVLAGAEQTLEHELRTGGIKKEVIPNALKRCIQFISLFTFIWGRTLRRKAKTAK